MTPLADTLDELAVRAVVEELTREFGPGFSNGVFAILLHRELPEHFEKKAWAGWTFRPADAAFEWAHNRGLIVPWKLSTKWSFTPLGRAVAAHFQAELLDDAQSTSLRARASLIRREG